MRFRWANSISIFFRCRLEVRYASVFAIYELVAVFKNGKAAHINNVELGRHGRYRTNVWDYAGIGSLGAGRAEQLAMHSTCKPVFIGIKAPDEFKCKTTAHHQLWQIDFTYLKDIGWGWFYLSTMLDDFSRYIIAWKLCTTMKAEDVTDRGLMFDSRGRRITR